MIRAQIFGRQHRQALFDPVCDAVIALMVVIGLNIIAWLFMHVLGRVPDPAQGMPTLFPLDHSKLQLILVVVGCNMAAVGFIVVLRQHVLKPWRNIKHVVQHASQSLADERLVAPTTISVRDIANTIARFAAHAQDAYSKCRALQHELDESRTMLSQIIGQHQIALASTNREIVEQYHHVLSYANYLDDHIRSRKLDPQLRYDFDDVCESGFNLKLIAQSLDLLRHPSYEAAPVHLSSLLQQTVIALAPTLERRAMQLSTHGVEHDVSALTDLRLLSHAVWMMLLGTIRYAAAEATLRLRCFASKEGFAIVSIGISELEPGQLTPEERYAHMERQLKHSTPHMFAETIRHHANAQLADLMLSRAGGQLHVLPLSTHACEISLILPIVKK